MKIVVADLAQIELRMNAWFCGEGWLIDALREGRDVYCELGTDIYGRLITKADELERYVGKQGELSCGYQSGPNKFFGTMRGHGVKITLEEAQRAVKVYRAKHVNIVHMWAWLQKTAIPILAGTSLLEWTQLRGCRFSKGQILLPSGRSLWYPDLHVDESGDWKYRVNKKRNQGNEWKKLYGGMVLENLIQALSYDVFVGHLLEAQRRGFPVVMAVHDEGVWCVRDDLAETVKRVAEEVMAIPPVWCADAPLKAEAGIGDDYAEAKKNAG